MKKLARRSKKTRAATRPSNELIEQVGKIVQANAVEVGLVQAVRDVNVGARLGSPLRIAREFDRQRWGTISRELLGELVPLIDAVESIRSVVTTVRCALSNVDPDDCETIAHALTLNAEAPLNRVLDQLNSVRDAVRDMPARPGVAR